MKTLMLFLLLSVCAFGYSQEAQKEVNFLPSSKLSISGDTNINEFLCTYNSEFLPERISIGYSHGPSEIEFKNAVLLLKDTGFDCGSKGINRDFYDLMKAEKFPTIRLDLQKIKMDCAVTGVAFLKIAIAGKDKFYQVPIKINTSDVLRFQGTLSLNISDFDLEPPHKMFGLIVVKDDININFNITVKNNETWATN